jgi:carbamoyl-phosphate synthase small subunit
MPVAIGVDIAEAELRDMAASAPSMVGLDLASGVTTKERYTLEPSGERRGRVVAIDLGMKRDILANLTGRGFEVEVVPSSTDAGTVLSLEPDGVFVSNGPGDPEPLTTATETLRALLGEVPLFGICLGHQVMGLAVGASTYKLPFGHHGGNHPVRRLADGRVEITAQNHGFAVDLWSLTRETAPRRSGRVGADLLPQRVESALGPLLPTHQNLNDGTLEGMRLLDVPAFSVQYHPEAAPGPRDASGHFDEFTRLIEEGA